MVDMTDEEVVEYVMMLSKEQDDEDTAIAASELEHIQDLEQQYMLEQRLLEEIENGGEGSSMSTSRSVSRSTANELVSEQELEEEEELVRRAIELSMLDIEPTDGRHDHHHHHHHHHHENDDSGALVGLEAFAPDEAHSQCHQPLEWDPSQVLDVDAEVSDTQVSQKDQAVVDAILKELQDEEDQVRAATETGHSTPNTSNVVGADGWPSISKALPTSESTSSSSMLFSSATAASTSTSEPIVKSQEPAAPKMTWSMVARTNSESSLGSIATATQGTGQGPPEQVPPVGRQPAIFRQYSQSAMQEEIEDEETQLARILSLSMVEK